MDGCVKFHLLIVLTQKEFILNVFTAIGFFHFFLWITTAQVWVSENSMEPWKCHPYFAQFWLHHINTISSIQQGWQQCFCEYAFLAFLMQKIDCRCTDSWSVRFSWCKPKSSEDKTLSPLLFKICGFVMFLLMIINTSISSSPVGPAHKYLYWVFPWYVCLRNRFALTVICCLIYHWLEVSR